MYTYHIYIVSGGACLPPGSLPCARLLYRPSLFSYISFLFPFSYCVIDYRYVRDSVAVSSIYRAFRDRVAWSPARPGSDRQRGGPVLSSAARSGPARLFCAAEKTFKNRLTMHICWCIMMAHSNKRTTNDTASTDYGNQLIA